MKRSGIQKLIAGITLGLTAVCGTICFADNPIVQTVYTADPAPMVYKDTLYLYTSHDEDKSTKYVMKDWRCYSTTDMVNWTDHGVPLSLKDFSWAKSDAWAGQCIERDGKFYYYVPVILKNGKGAIGVAVSDSPTGPFHDALGHLLVTTGKGDIDPTVFIDDDGQAYMYWGNPKLFYVKLNKDMISFDTSIGNKGVVEVPLTVESFGPGNGRSWCKRDTLYEEGPWFYKRNGLYYLVYAASGLPENICYATSPNATGPWVFKGVIIPTEGGSSTNHPGLTDYKGHSYFFYHNDALPGGGSYTRSVCVEEFKYNADGSFPTISMSKEGPVRIGRLDPYTRTEAETICFSTGVKTEVCSAGGMDVCNIKNSSYIKVKGVDFAKGAKSFKASVASETKGGKIEIYLDNLTTGTLVGTLVGTLDVPSTGGAQEWKEKSCKIKNAKGVHDLYFKFVGEDGVLFNFDWWKFE
ncbi:TPA: carbohydrate-binding protein [Candidatus Sumerlaeota bacterium]|jgi:arabinoxylan arabinofuranohydrolase|nr:carbohydrate-binding protein [Candidatus Sumerlaeota bacterium]